MDPQAAETQIRNARHLPAVLSPLPTLRRVWVYGLSAISFVNLIACALAMRSVITKGTWGLAVMIAGAVCAAAIFATLLYAILGRRQRVVRPTMRIDRHPGPHTIDEHFENFVPDGDICILQTWIPNPGDPPGVAPTRIGLWAKSLRDALGRYAAVAAPEIELRVLLAGSEDVLMNRIRYRSDLAEDYELAYPVGDAGLRRIAADKMQHIDRIHGALLDLEREVREFLLAQRSRVSFRVRIRYYRITPCSPLYIFGQHALLTGFYDHRWTSDRAPSIRLDDPESAEWVNFKTQFECIWQLSDTTSLPSWKPPLADGGAAHHHA